MKLALFVFVIGMGLTSIAQSKSDLIGKWEVAKLEMTEKIEVPDHVRETVRLMREAFSKAVFHLRSDGSCDIEIDFMDLGVKDGVWIYDPAKHYFRVDGKTESNLYGVYVRKDRMGKSIFLIDESPIALTMMKIDD